VSVLQSGRLVVKSLMANSPCNGVLQRGDIIQQIDGKGVRTVNELRSRLTAGTPKTTLTIVFQRSGLSGKACFRKGVRNGTPVLEQLLKDTPRQGSDTGAAEPLYTALFKQIEELESSLKQAHR
jgi:hypothetical protein